MNKLVCENCGAIVRSGKKFSREDDTCPHCKGRLAVNIKGSGTLYTDLDSVGAVRIPRWFRPVLRDGSPCSKSAVRGALPSSGRSV